MKKYFLLLFVIFSCAAPVTYQSTIDPYGTKIITGRFPRSVLESDSAFTWFHTGYNAFEPDGQSIAFLDSAARDLDVIVFCGTWCSDTRRELPRFFKTVDRAHMGMNHITMYGVDRTKRSNDGLTDQFNINRVPTIILMSHGTEMGRFVEHPRESIEKDLVRIIRKH